MNTRHSTGIAIVVGVFLAVACVGPGDAAGGACEEFGGVCVASADLCGGSLPYQCNSGSCCATQLPGAPEGGADGSTILPFTDATVVKFDATLGSDSGGDASSSDVVVSPPDTGAPETPPPVDAPPPPMDVSSGDTGSGVDGGHEASVDAHTEDVHADSHREDGGDDAKEEDAREDVKHDAGKDSAVLCNHYASPSEPATACNKGGNACTGDGECASNDCSGGKCTALCPSDPNCQPNSCLNGDWCHITTGNCVMPAAVMCDGGI